MVGQGRRGTHVDLAVQDPLNLADSLPTVLIACTI